jgi:hypothetical protein
MKIECECKQAGWCVKRQRNVGSREFAYCSGTSGLTREEELAYLKVLDSPSVLQSAKGISKKIWKFTEAFAKWVKSGFKIVQQEDLDKRLNVCKTCEHFNSTLTKCDYCGCLLSIKARWATEDCPLTPSKWPAIALPVIEAPSDDRLNISTTCCGGSAPPPINEAQQ